MKNKDKPKEIKIGLKMSFEEAIKRLIRVKPPKTKKKKK